MKINYFIQISPLLEKHHTGIAVVCKQIVSFFLDIKTENDHDKNKETTQESYHFFHDNLMFKEEMINDLISGKISHSSIKEEHILDKVDEFLKKNQGINVGLFIDVKPFHKKFDYEAQIIHDLTYQLIPNYHDKKMVYLFGNNENVEL